MEQELGEEPFLTAQPEEKALFLPLVSFLPATLMPVSHAEMQKGNEYGAELNKAVIVTLQRKRRGSSIRALPRGKSRTNLPQWTKKVLNQRVSSLEPES